MIRQIEEDGQALEEAWIDYHDAASVRPPDTFERPRAEYRELDYRSVHAAMLAHIVPAVVADDDDAPGTAHAMVLIDVDLPGLRAEREMKMGMDQNHDPV